MAIPGGAHELGPGNATLQVKTYRQGMASKAGHDLVLDVTRWQATVVAGEGDPPLSVELTADPRSFEVNAGLHGVKPLSDRDRADIVENIDSKVLGGRPIEFRSTATELAGDGGRLSVRGDLTMAGETRPVSLELDVSPDGRVSGAVPITQSEWGIEPYSAMMGALKVRDEVDIVLEARLPAS